MREEVIRDEYFDRDKGNEAVQWTSDIAGDLVEMGFRVTKMTLASVFDESGMIVMRYHSRVSGWREVDPEEAAGPFDTTPGHYPEMDVSLTAQPTRIKLGDFTTEGWKNVRDYAIYDRIKQHIDDGEIVAMDLKTGAHSALTNFTMPEPTAADLDARDHFASEVRDLHPTQLDRIEKRLAEIERQLGISGV